MCIAVPVKIVDILDDTDFIVQVESSHGRGEVCATLVAESGRGVADLLGRWAIVHSGYVLSLLDDQDARSRLAVFAAMDGLAVDDASLHPEEE
jgi:hydrogenase expression/formation protein HypC